MPIAHFKRDPFARATRVRMRAYVAPAVCAWCGGYPVRKNKVYLYFYGWESDTGKAHFDPEPFCSASCHDAYHHE